MVKQIETIHSSAFLTLILRLPPAQKFPLLNRAQLFRQAGNRLSGNAGTAYAGLLA